MAKKKRRYNKKRKKRRATPQCMVNDIHHILWTRRNWGKGYWSYKLRNHPYMKISIPKCTLHREIHSLIKCIPVPKESVCRSVYEQLEMLYKVEAIKDSDNLIKRLDLLIFMLEYAADDTVAPLKKQRAVARRFYSKSG